MIRSLSNKMHGEIIFIYTYTTDASGRRESATIKSLGSDNAVGGTGTAEDIQILIDANEVFSASSASCNVLVRYYFYTAPTFNFANITVHIVYSRTGEGLDTCNSTFVSPVTVTGNDGNPQNNYTFRFTELLQFLHRN